MSRSGWLVLAAGIALGGVALLLHLAGGERGSARPVGAGPSEDRPPETERGRPELVSPLEAEVEPASPGLDAAPAAREALETRASEAHPTLSLEIEVVEAGTLRPIAGADVWYHEGEEDWSPIRLDGLREQAAHATADERGLARIPRPGLEGDEGLLVLASSGALLGGERFEAGDERLAGGARLRLELHPDWDLAVLVVDASHEPAVRVPIELRSRSEGWSSSSREETGADGRVLFRHVGLELARGPGRVHRVRVDLPLAQELFQELAGGPPAQPVRFVLPPLGSVSVTAVEASGEPVGDGTVLELGIVRPGEERDISPFSSRRREHDQRETAGGRALFEFVELGGEVELLASRPGSAVNTKDYFPGPGVAGQRVERRLVLGLDHPVLVFRAVDERARPLAGAELELHLWSRSHWMIDENEQELTTDAEGRFRVDLSPAFSEGDRRSLVVTLEDTSAGARVDLGRPFESGTIVMGDLVLAPPPLLASGRVVDGAGHPVALAEVQFEVPVREDEDQDEVWYWREVNVPCKSDDSGAFSARAFVDGAEVRLTAAREGLRGEPLEVPVGSGGLALVLQGTGWVAGSLLLDPGVPANDVRVSLRREGGPADEEVAWREGAEPGADGRFRIEDQLPGRYTLEVGLQRDESLVEIGGVEVVGGQGARDPRLEGIDLRGRLHVMRVTLVLPRPDPDLRGNLSYSPSGMSGGMSGESGGRERWKWFRENPIVLVTPHARVDATLFAQGYRTEHLAELSGEREVRLRPALAVILALPSGVDLPAPPIYLKAALAPVDGDRHIDWGGNAFDERREIRCFAPAPGPMKVRWIFERRSEGSATASTIELDREQVVEVLDVEGEQRFELQVSREALAKVLAQPPF